jgi:hypothetical protein
LSVSTGFLPVRKMLLSVAGKIFGRRTSRPDPG